MNSPLAFSLLFDRVSPDRPAGFDIIWGSALKQAAQGQMDDPGMLGVKLTAGEERWGERWEERWCDVSDWLKMEEEVGRSWR